MSRLVLLLGGSGTGKSTSLRNLTAKDVNVISVMGKELPFKTDIKVYKPKNGYDSVIKAVHSADKPIVVIDDTNYLMTNFEFATINENGYGKFARNALGMVQVFNAILDKESDQTFYVMAHTDKDQPDVVAMMTSGKMVSEKFNPNGITNIVIQSEYDKEAEEFVFKVKADGTGIKTPLGMFDTPTVPNDLKVVNDTITNFYGGK